MSSPINILEIIRGTTNTIQIDVTDASGAPYALENGEVLRFGVKRNAASSDYLIRKDVAAGTGSYLVTLMPEDTAVVPLASYLFDVGLQCGSDYYPPRPSWFGPT